MTDRAAIAQRALMLHYATACETDPAIASWDAEPYRATRAAAYVAVLDYLQGDDPYYRQPVPSCPAVAWDVVSWVLPDSGLEPIADMVKAARDHLAYGAASPAFGRCWCGCIATYLQPCDRAVTNGPIYRLDNGDIVTPVCEEHTSEYSAPWSLTEGIARNATEES